MDAFGFQELVHHRRQPEEFEIAGVARGKAGPVKILGQGDIAIKLTVRAHKFSARAREKIESAGGTAETIE